MPNSLTDKEMEALLTELPDFPSSKKASKTKELNFFDTLIKRIKNKFALNRKRPDADVVYICETCRKQMQKIKILSEYPKPPAYGIYCEQCEYTQVIKNTHK